MARARRSSGKRSPGRVGKANIGAPASQPEREDSVPNAEPYNSLLLIDDMKALPGLRVQLARQLQDHPVVWFSLVHPYSKTAQLLDENGIRHDKTFFIDTISNAGAGKPIERTKNALLLHDASDLTGMAMALDAALQEMSGEKYIVLCDLPGLHFYNPQPVVLNFLQLLIEHARETDAHLVALAPRGQEDEFISECRRFFEQVAEGRHGSESDSADRQVSPLTSRPSRVPYWSLSGTLIWLLVIAVGVLALELCMSYLGRWNRDWNQNVLMSLIILQAVICGFILIARTRSRWNSGVYEWLLAGVLVSLGHSILYALASLSALENARTSGALLQLVAMGCFLMASLRMKDFANRYGFLKLDWMPPGAAQKRNKGRPAP